MPSSINSPLTNGNGVDIVAQARNSVALATEYSWHIAKDDGHWNGELRSNATITAEQIFFYQSLGKPIPDADAYKRYLLSQQQDDGSWSIAPFYPGDVSTSSETYLALKILGVSPDMPEMRKARAFIRQCGGVAKVRIFTRIFFAQFGLFPWDAVPQLPAEFILMPSSFSCNVYRLSSWARSTLIPLLVIRHHEKVYELPNGLSRDNKFLDELWLDPTTKMVPYSPSLLDSKGNDWFSLMFSTIDNVLYWLGGLKRQPLRPYALRRCIQWILDHQEVEGDWAGIIPPMHAGVQALLLEGYTLESDVIRRGISAIERFTWHDKEGKRLQSCVSPLWDTVLMTRGLCNAGIDTDDPRLRKAIQWIKSRQLVGREGDWRVYNPKLAPGGFSFEYHNTWYPDTDDTAAAILAMITQNPDSAHSLPVYRATIWLCGMQNRDGGWGAFDLDNDSLWFNKIPFSDMDALCDPSSADVTGRILEAFGAMLKISEKAHVDAEIVRRISKACDAAISYLANTQEPSGAWYGRWGSNYIYGTSNTLCGLQYFSQGKELIQNMMASATAWLKRVQNDDGGWGENLESYRDASIAGKGPSTPSQTAWGLMGLLTTCNPDDKAVVAAVSHLTNTQSDILEIGASWPETRYTGTGFPNFFYIGYSLYRHYFPMMALGRYVKAVSSSQKPVP
ncbi:hypothetical protein NM208_g7971 [Fusarium decemcellulare]|uniref:Uncharacterized protein n=1 Tax=Fusarium decemcellulare TaxID=57161 RepID=A0ACC1S7M4_9HYPO|nr:hypothetical protein NM208_g7971 [Fusarium decemcellulare]